ncbi:MAG: imidazole glycerol phosphate synthase subunit HisF [Rhodocyclaceae bacterium]|jgi:cyclase|nr:imidazole glycerol phosphate synthase subunit HisF [Rhodocyclaceae bacterium]
MIRIIPRLDIKGPNVVKGVNLEGMRVVGRPELFAPHYYDEGADELLFMDTVASLYGRNTLDEIVHRTAERMFVPLTVSGGIRSVQDIRGVLRAGADKVAMNTAAIANPRLVAEGAEHFGSQCIVLSIEARRLPDGRYECLTDGGRERTGKDAIEWAEEAAGLGAGEILATSVDNEGTGRGFDLELTRLISERVGVPVIASGGAGCAEHVRDVVLIGKADAVCIASILHYGCLEAMENVAYAEEGNTDFLKRKIPVSSRSAHNRRGIQPVRLAELKQNLADWGIEVRRTERDAA